MTLQSAIRKLDLFGVPHSLIMYQHEKQNGKKSFTKSYKSIPGAFFSIMLVFVATFYLGDLLVAMMSGAKDYVNTIHTINDY